MYGRVMFLNQSIIQRGFCGEVTKEKKNDKSFTAWAVTAQAC